jgi:transcriptional regulator with XRE-family HTH domain
MAVAQKAGVSDAIVSYLETNQRLPTVGTIARLASALAVSAAWLAYGLGEPTSEGAAANCDQMGARLEAVRDERKISRAELARLTELSPGAIAKIEHGGSSGVHIVEALAQALSVSPGWLGFGEGPKVLPPSRRGRPRSQPADPAG